MIARYVIDADVLIQSKNFWYKFTYCRTFWKWIEDGHAHGMFFSSKKIRDEINQGHASCPVRHWVKSSVPAAFFLDDMAAMQQYANVMQWAYQQHASGVYSAMALSDFSKQSKADPFLIATAAQNSLTIVTHETPNMVGTNQRSIKIPNAASAMGVNTITIFQLLDKHAGPGFTFKP